MRERRLIAADLFYPSGKREFTSLLEPADPADRQRLSLPAAILIPQGALERTKDYIRSAFDRIELSQVRRVLLILPLHGPRLKEHEGYLLFEQQQPIQTAFGALETIGIEQEGVLATDIFADEEPALEMCAALVQHYCFSARVQVLFTASVDAATSKLLASRIDAFCDDTTLVIISGNASGYEPQDAAYEHAACFQESLLAFRSEAPRPSMLETYRAGKLTGSATLACDALHRSRVSIAPWDICAGPRRIDPEDGRTVYHLSAAMKLNYPRREP